MTQTTHLAGPRAGRSPAPAARSMTARRLIYMLLAGLLAFAAVNVGSEDGRTRLSSTENSRGLDRAA